VREFISAGFLSSLPEKSLLSHDPHSPFSSHRRRPPGSPYGNFLSPSSFSRDGPSPSSIGKPPPPPPPPPLQSRDEKRFSTLFVFLSSSATRALSPPIAQKSVPLFSLSLHESCIMPSLRINFSCFFHARPSSPGFLRAPAFPSINRSRPPCRFNLSPLFLPSCPVVNPPGIRVD